MIEELLHSTQRQAITKQKYIGKAVFHLHITRTSKYQYNMIDMTFNTLSKFFKLYGKIGQ